MHDGELELTEETAARLIAQRSPALAHLPIERVHTTGTVNTIVRVGDAYAGGSATISILNPWSFSIHPA